MTEENKNNQADQTEDLQDSILDRPEEQRKADLFARSFLAGMFGGAIIVGCMILVLLFTPSLSSLRKNMTDTSCSLQNKGLSQIISYPLCCPFCLGLLGEPFYFIETFKGFFNSFIRPQDPQKPKEGQPQETPGPSFNETSLNEISCKEPSCKETSCQENSYKESSFKKEEAQP